MTESKATAAASPTWRSLYPVHPCADVYPMVSDAELEALAADIKKNGLQHQVVIWQERGKYFVLDGRNRLDALTRLGVVLSADAISQKNSRPS